ncbi:hypothetical protein BYT27DRAFT_6933111 [Phlegmacium glaucopus]|nr:hypothetical protein BYT27DRAFT_6933111 [Phlegmacium glaucopus]
MYVEYVTFSTIYSMTYICQQNTVSITITLKIVFLLSVITFVFINSNVQHSLSKIMSSILSGLSPNINSKETTYCAIVTAILGHLSFFLYKESPSTADSLERAVQIYQQSPCDTSVKQAVNNYFENLSKGSHVNHKLLVQEAVQIAMNNLISRK